MEHLENIYGGGKFSFAVTDGFKEKHGNTIDYKRHEDLQGKTIKKVTYLVKNGADIVINTNLKCKTLAGSDALKLPPTITLKMVQPFLLILLLFLLVLIIL